MTFGEQILGHFEQHPKVFSNVLNMHITYYANKKTESEKNELTLRNEEKYKLCKDFLLNLTIGDKFSESEVNFLISI